MFLAYVASLCYSLLMTFKAEAQITILSQQLEESFQIRETEAEQLLKRQEAQYETQLQGMCIDSLKCIN